MKYSNLNLTNCDKELIHIPGQIQSHGFMIVADPDNRVSHFSENIHSFIPQMEEDITGKPLSYIESFFSKELKPVLLKQLIYIGRSISSFEQINPAAVLIGKKLYHLIFSLSGLNVIMEFEETSSARDADMQRMIGRSITSMLGDKKPEHLLKNAAMQVKETIGYDRVMVYRFAEDGHGEVVAEAKNDSLEPWLGLHYPASDIPKQARELYKLNLTRLIADVEDIPSKIFTTHNNAEPLDLTASQLRAVSPVHIQYLKNMGVASSFSLSLICKNELWGLIACHNYSPAFIDYKLRESSKLVAKILSSSLEFRQEEENHEVHELFDSNIDTIVRQLQNNNDIALALTADPVTILHVAHSPGAIIFIQNTIIKLGITPEEHELQNLISWVKGQKQRAIFHTDHISSIYQPAAAFKDKASGMLVLTVSKELDEYIIWFKPERLQQIKWAGNPDKQINSDKEGLISPRNSFKEWAQTVVGVSDSWTTEELRSISRLREEIMHAVNSKATAIRLLNERLRQAYDALDTFSFTISHDLKNPITAIKSYSQLLLKDPSIGDDAQKLLLRIGDRTDKMNFMINAVLDYSRISRLDIVYQTIDMKAMLQDIVHDLDIDDGEQGITIYIGETPDLAGDPVMISQVFSNLIGNAVKYSRHVDKAVIRVEGRLWEKDICYTIADNGMGIHPHDLEQIFVLFSRMENAKAVEGSGVGLAIVKRIVEKHNGLISVQSKPGEGAVFEIKFSRQPVTR